MYKIICLTVACLMLCTIIITYTGSETVDEQLAYRISKSENFNAIMNYGKVMAGIVKVMPDSTKNKLRELKPRMDYLLSKYKSLPHSQVRDSLFKITNLVKSEKVFDSAFLKQSMVMGPVYKGFYSEFPEYKKMSRAEKSIVFRKAAAIWLKNPK